MPCRLSGTFSVTHAPFDAASSFRRMKGSKGRRNAEVVRNYTGGERSNVLMRLGHGALQSLATRRLYRHTLIGRVPDRLKLKIEQPWPSDPRLGKAIAAGELEFSHEKVRDPHPRWFPPAASDEWLAAWHSFAWLPDLLSAQGSARDTARELIQSWLAENVRWRPIVWRADVLATRVFSWFAHFDAIAGTDQDQPIGRAILVSLAAQLRHLSRTASWEIDGAARLRALKGLVAGTAALGGSTARLTRALTALERELPAQILSDGSHRSRSPSAQLQVLRDLIDTRAVLRLAQVEPPPRLQDAIERMAPMLRLFRHGDRRLALFNGSIEEDGVLIDLVLTRSETKGRTLTHAPDAGFERMQADQSLVIVDTGTRAPSGFDSFAHAGALSFELSHGRERIVVNCGAYHGSKSNSLRVARASAAHSVLVVADTNSTEIRDDGMASRRPTTVSCERAEDEGRQWISATHDGYRERFGLVYTRELFLSADGGDLRGEDRLTGRPGAMFAVRFHLHPSVQASLAEGGTTAVLRLPSGSCWRLRAAGAEMSLGDSIYLGSGEVRKTQQVVLSGVAAPGGTTVRWALRCEPLEQNLE